MTNTADRCGPTLQGLQRRRIGTGAAPYLGFRLPVLQLPSSSPANASWSFERKLQVWWAAFRQAGIA